MSLNIKKILFISHDATLTGAPLLLINLLDCIKDLKDYAFKIIINNNKGGLLKEFRKRGEVCVLYNIPQRSNNYLFFIVSRIIAFTTRKYRAIKIQNWINSSDIIFLNTITQGDFLKTFKFSQNQKIICYIHELELVAENIVKKESINYLIKNNNLFLVPSQAVREFLIHRKKIQEDIIKNLNYFIPDINSTTNEPEDEYANNVFKIGMIGTLDSRKGADLVPIILENLFRRYPDNPIQFIWKGADLNSVLYSQINAELEKLGLTKKIIFEDAGPDTIRFYNQIKILLLCSREDPFPLIVLESARLKIPCVCFENCGGAPEFVGQDSGIVVPYLNFDLLSDALIRLSNNEKERIEKGNNAFLKYKNNYGNKELIQNQFNSIIKSLK